MSTTQNLSFQPLMGEEAKIKQLTQTEGYLGFSTDTKKMFLGLKDGFTPICDNIGLFYGIKEIEYDNSGVAPNPEVFFNPTDLEATVRVPVVGDLILNKDGCFYRIKDIEDESYKTERLTLQGTGSGGGTGGGPGGTVTGSFNLVILGSRDHVYSSTADEMKVRFKCNYNGTDDNYISQIIFKLKDAEEPFFTSDKQRPFNTEDFVDLFKYKNLFNSMKTSVTMYVYDAYGMERSTNISIRIVDLELQKNQSDLIYTKDQSFLYSCDLLGATEGIEDKKITYTLYTEDNLNTEILVLEKELLPTAADTISHTLNLLTLSHGVYVLKVQASAKITGTSNTLTSNILVHKIGKFDTNSNQPLLMIAVPEVTEQYTNIPVQYLLLTNEATNKPYTLNISLNGESKIDLTIQSNKEGEYNLYFEDRGNYSLLASILELNISRALLLEIKAYTGNLPVIDENNLIFYLNPRNKSNNAIDKDIWIDSKNGYIGELSNFHYGVTNGWLIDDNGNNSLKLSSGAALTFKDFMPFKQEPKTTGMTIELDFEVNGVLNYNTDLISCFSTNKDLEVKSGFKITGNTISFYGSSGTLLSLKYVEGKRIKVSFVIEKSTTNYPMAYVYLNGKLSGAAFYETASFEDNEYPAKLKVDSTAAQIKLYSVRFYSSVLNDKTILNNYIASLNVLEDRQASYDTNNVYKGNSDEIDFIKVNSEEYSSRIPYMILTGGYATEAKSKWKRKDNTGDIIGRLPTGKKDYRMVDVEVKYPKNEDFNGYDDYKFKNKFASGKPMATAYGETPINGGAIMYAQGTSSMEYPVKNLRLRFKEDKNWYTVRPDIVPVEIICMKADYMESSGSHNTGAANFIDALYDGAGIATPGQEHFGGADKKTIVTCIKGHPCLIFYSDTGEPGSYKYVGKYNLNLDKATPEPFGFDHDDSDFGYLEPGDEYYEIEYDDDDKYIDTKEGEDLKYVAEGEKVNAIHCFEFLDNTVEVCNFLGKQQLQSVLGLTESEFDNNSSGRYYIKTVLDNGSEKYVLAPNDFNPTFEYFLNTPLDYESTWYNTYMNKDNELVPGWTLGFESRYPEDRVGYHDADALYPLASWLNELHNLRMGFGVTKDVKLALARFKNEYKNYFDKDFLLTYYLVTEALLMVDNRVKNMMIATWGKESRSYYATYIKDEKGDYVPDKSTEQTTVKNYIFYPIFYDMDTMLGLDNSGVYRFNYYDEDTNTSVFNGDEVLWNFVRDALQDELLPWYSKLEDSKLKASEILPYFNAKQANMANEAFYNSDAKYKYINPAREGYRDDLHKEDISPGAGPYLYAAQGDRSLMREWFINNRMSFLKGKYNSKEFKNSDRLVYRWYYPSGNEDEFAGHSASITAVPPSSIFTFKSIKTGYAGILLGANGSAYIERFDGEEVQNIDTLTASSANGTEAYILGLSNLSDLGNLSDKYVQKLIITATDVRLKNLELGNSHKDYYNPYWSTTVGGESPTIDVSKGIYLEKFDLQNCSTYHGSLDFTNCAAIKTILLTGSGVNSLTLPINGVLEELRLPTSIGELKIESHSKLTADKFSIGTYVYDTTLPYEDQRIGKGNGYYQSDYNGLSNLKVVNTPIDTYEIVTRANNLIKYCLQGISWNITSNNVMYCAREEVEITNNFTDYYYYDSNTKTYKPYTGSSYPEVGKLYEKVDLIVNGEIVRIPVLEFLKTRTPFEASRAAEALTGNININIPAQDGVKIKVDELSIYNRYKNLYPNVTFTYGTEMDVTKSNKIKFYSIDANSITGNDISNFEYYFFTQCGGTETLSDLTAEDTGFKAPIKSSTATDTFTFTGNWMDWNTKKIYYQSGYAAQTPDAISFESYAPTADMELFPIFITNARLYTVKMFDGISETLIYQISGTYGQNVLSALEKESKGWLAYYHYKPNDNNISSNERYTFKGWKSESDHNNKVVSPNFYDLNDLIITQDLKIYSHYIVENVKKVPMSYEYFDISDSTIKIKEKYRNVLQGKITLPSVDSTSVSIKIIGDFQRVLCSEIYFLEDAVYTEVASRAFYVEDDATADKKTLERIELPNTIYKIGDYAFSNQSNLIDVSAIKYCLPYKEGNAEFDIKQRAFRSCNKLQLSYFPDNLKHLQEAVFTNSSGSLSFSDYNNIERIENGVMYGTNQSTVKKVDLSKVTYINGNTNKAFQNAYDYVEEVIYNNNLVITNLTTTSTDLVEQLKELGFTRTNITFTGIN